jgi:hypothetical protein
MEDSPLSQSRHSRSQMATNIETPLADMMIAGSRTTLVFHFVLLPGWPFALA